MGSAGTRLDCSPASDRVVTMRGFFIATRGRQSESHRTHNPEIVSSTLAPATNKRNE